MCNCQPWPFWQLSIWAHKIGYNWDHYGNCHHEIANCHYDKFQVGPEWLLSSGVTKRGVGGATCPGCYHQGGAKKESGLTFQELVVESGLFCVKLANTLSPVDNKCYQQHALTYFFLASINGKKPKNLFCLSVFLKKKN